MMVLEKAVLRAMRQDDKPGLCALLARNVASGASIGFLAPLAQEVAARYWHQVYADMLEGRRLALVACDGQGGLLGTAQLEFCFKENGGHRAEVQKLMVAPEARRQGIASRLMRQLEEEARLERVELLVLDTAKGSEAERLYQGLGWTRAGEIPDFALDAVTRQPHATAMYWKRL